MAIEYTRVWTNPNWDTDVATKLHDSLFNNPDLRPGMASCTNCGGVGRHIYIDPSDGSMKDISCGNCNGSGQVPDPQ